MRISRNKWENRNYWCFGCYWDLIEFKGVKENKWGLCFGEKKRGNRSVAFFSRTIETRKTRVFERKRRKTKIKGEELRGGDFCRVFDSSKFK